MPTDLDALLTALGPQDMSRQHAGQQLLDWLTQVTSGGTTSPVAALQQALSGVQGSASGAVPPQWSAPLVSATAPAWQPPDEEPQLSQVSLGVLPGAKPGYPGRHIWQHANDPGYSTHLNSIEEIGGKHYIIPTIFNGQIVPRDMVRQLAIQHNLIDPETGHPFPEETGFIEEGPHAGWGIVEKQLHDDLEQQAQHAIQGTDNGRRYLQWREQQ